MIGGGVPLYLTLSEGIKLAPQTFTRDVAKLWCCADTALREVAFGSLAPPSLNPLAYDQRQHRQRRNRIGPPPVERGVQRQAQQRRERQPRAHDGLVCVRRAGPGCPAPERSAAWRGQATV